MQKAGRPGGKGLRPSTETSMVKKLQAGSQSRKRMVCRRKKKATVSAIRQPTSFNFDCWASSQSCFFASTTSTFDKGPRSFSRGQLFSLLNLGGVRVCPLAHFARAKSQQLIEYAFQGCGRSGWPSLNLHFSRRGHPELAKGLARSAYRP